MIDAQMRLLKRSRAARAWRLRDLVLTSLLTGAFLFVLFGGSIAGRLVMAGIGVLFGAVLSPVLSSMTVKRRLRKWCEENAGSDRPLTCQVELNESGIHTESNGARISYAWENVKEIQETEDSVDIYFERGGLVVVRQRAFASAEERHHFIELAEQYLKMAHGAHSSDANKT